MDDSERAPLRWEIGLGYASLALGIAGAAMERGAPTLQAPIAEVVAFFETYRTELLWQSLAFVLSSGVALWFYGALRDVLHRAEGAPGRVSTIAFAAAVVGVVLQFVMQSVQASLALGASDMEASVVVAFGRFSFLLTVVAYVPAAVTYAAVGVVTLRHDALPRSLGWFSLLTAGLHGVMAFGLVATTGPLVPGEPLTYVLYLFALAWLPWTVTAALQRLSRARRP